jgi:ABC-type phosphate transport system auxiliary subunit
MCPLCLSALGWIAAGGVSAAGLGALSVVLVCPPDGLRRHWPRRMEDDHDDASHGDS